MIFDLLSLFTVIGLLVKGLKKGASKLSFFVSVGISILVSGALVPVYMKFMNLPKDVPAAIISFLITFVFAYVIISVPTLIFSVVIGGIVIIFAYGAIVFVLPAGTKNVLIQNSKIYPMLYPLIAQLMNILHFQIGTP